MNTGTKRTAYLPDVPTVIESSIKDYDVASWNGLSVLAENSSSNRRHAQHGHERRHSCPQIQSNGLAPRALPAPSPVRQALSVLPLFKELGRSARTMRPVELSRGTGS